MASGAVADRDQFSRTENPNCRIGETANFFAELDVEFLVEFPLKLLMEIFGEFRVEVLARYGGFVDEVGLTGEPPPVDRAGKRPYVSDPNMPARFAHDPLQTAGDRGERLLVHTQSGSRPLDFYVKASQGNFRHD